MTLKSLVAFAQQNFASFEGLNNGYDTELALPIQSRPPLPSWLSEESTFEEFPYEAESWIIEGDANLPEPPANVSTLGADALAFYLPFHFYRERWGIYVLSSGVLHLASELKGGALSKGDEAYLEVADWILIEHEQFHANTEIAATRAELISRQSLYRPYFCDSVAASHEEALANANAIRWALTSNEDPLDVQPNLETWMKRQGPGYCDYHRWVSSRLFTSGLEKTGRHLIKTASSTNSQIGINSSYVSV